LVVATDDSVSNGVLFTFSFPALDEVERFRHDLHKPPYGCFRDSVLVGLPTAFSGAKAKRYLFQKYDSSTTKK
jgi:hypothetical protein